MNDKDVKLAHEIAWARAENNCSNGLEKRILTALTAVRQEAREEAFTAVGVELRRYGTNIRKVDLLARFQELYRELEAAANSVPKDSEPEGVDNGK